MTSRREKHGRPVPGGMWFWWSDRLWELAEALPVQEVAIDDIPEFDMDCWFLDRNVPTCRAVAEHARRINDADLSYPVLLSAEGRLMDGGHRIGKAYLLGHRTVRARRFPVDPEPDWIEETP